MFKLWEFSLQKLISVHFLGPIRYDWFFWQWHQENRQLPLAEEDKNTLFQQQPHRANRRWIRGVNPKSGDFDAHREYDPGFERLGTPDSPEKSFFALSFAKSSLRETPVSAVRRSQTSPSETSGLQEDQAEGACSGCGIFQDQRGQGNVAENRGEGEIAAAELGRAIDGFRGGKEENRGSHHQCQVIGRGSATEQNVAVWTNSWT